MRYTDLLAAKQSADKALADAEAELVEELVAAKDAHRKKPTAKTRERKAAAAAAVQEARGIARRNRPPGTGGIVGGDAFISTENGG